MPPQVTWVCAVALRTVFTRAIFWVWRSFASMVSVAGAGQVTLPETKATPVFGFTVPLEELVLCCLAKEPSHRPQSARELARRLGGIGEAQPWTAERAESWWREHQPNAPGPSLRSG